MTYLETATETPTSIAAVMDDSEPRSTRVLVVDDDPSVRDLFQRYLTHEGFEMSAASSSATATCLVESRSFDIVILDLMLGTDDGLDVARHIRRQSDVPINMLTAKGDEIDRIVGLELGADDYVLKPFNPRKLLARMKSVLRRSSRGRTRQSHGERESASEVARFAGWTVDVGNWQVMTPDKRRLKLSTGEFDLLVAFARNPRQVLSRDQLSEYTRGKTGRRVVRGIDLQVMRLRQKIEDDTKNSTLIKTVHGAGYIFAAQVEWS
jgi:DNA-binding response OmpR family regulator